MSGRLLLALQGIAVAAVGAMLGLLVWKLAADGESALPRALAQGKVVPAPAFSLPRLEGEGRVSLAQYRGKAVVLNFWASWCAPCEQESPFLERMWREYRGRGLVVLGIDSQDFRSDARAFARRHRLTYPLVYDGPGETIVDYGVAGFPETFFVDRRGRVVGERISGPVDEVEGRFRELVELALGPA